MVSNFTSPLLFNFLESSTPNPKLNPIKSTNNAVNVYNLKSTNQQLLIFETNIWNIENIYPFKLLVNWSISDQTTLSSALLNIPYTNSLGLVSTSYSKITQTNPTHEVLISKDSDTPLYYLYYFI